MATFSPPEAKKVKREKEEVLEEPSSDEPDVFYSFVLKGGITANVELRFDKRIISIDEPVRIATLADLSLIVHTGEEKGEKRDLLSRAVVTTKERGWQSYKLRQHLYESTRLRLGHLLPADLMDQPVFYVRSDDESRKERGQAECTLSIRLAAVERETDMRRVCGTVLAGGTLISCSREILGLYSSDPLIFVPEFTPVILDAAVAAVELREVTLRLVSSRHWDEITNVNSLIDIVIKCQAYGFSSLLSRYLASIKWRHIRSLTTTDILRLAIACGEPANRLVTNHFSRFKSAACLRAVYEEHSDHLTPFVVRTMLKTMFKLSCLVHNRPRICFDFEEGKVEVELAADHNDAHTRELLLWMGRKMPEVLKRKRGESLRFRESFPSEATADPEDTEGRLLPLHGYRSQPQQQPPYLPGALLGATIMVEVSGDASKRSRQRYALRFSRSCRQPLGVVVRGGEHVSRATKLNQITVTDAIKYTISEKQADNQCLYALHLYDEKEDDDDIVEM